MPRVVVQPVAHGRSRCAEVLLGQSLYQTTMLPYLDVEKDTAALKPMSDRIQVENVLPYEKEDEETILRDEEDENVVSYETVSVSTTPADEDVCAVRTRVPVPSMESEVASLFAHSRAMPPPPPMQVKSVAPLRFWYTRVASDDALLNSCNMLAGFALAAFPESEEEMTADVTSWMMHANAWWESLSTVMKTNGLGFNVPLRMRWNPYSVALTRRFTAMPTTVSKVVPSTIEAQNFARFAPPPPPVYAELFEEMLDMTHDEVNAERAAQNVLASWWRSATAWAAATVSTNAWLCPPPTTADTTEAWFNACRQWCVYVSKQLRVVDKASRRQRTATPSTCSY